MRSPSQRNALLTDLHIAENFRTEQGNIDELAEVIRQKGFLQPITIRPDGLILAGRRRFLAAQAAGLESIPVIEVHTEDELDEREIELFENIHRKDLTWQERMKLTVRIHELMQAKHGDQWSQRKTAKLLGRDPADIVRAVEMSRAIEAIPELAEAKTADAARKAFKRLAEDAILEEALDEAEDEVNEALRWAADHYRVEDFFTATKKLGGEICDIAEVDPPYGIALNEHQPGAATYNEIPASDYPVFVRNVASTTFKILRQNSWCIWWFGPTWHDVVRKALLDAGFKIDDIPAIWFKDGTASQSGNPNVYLNRGYEPFFLARKGQPILRRRGRSNVFSYPSPRGDRHHPCERPIELIQDILSTLAFPGAKVCVPFLGSGNTLLAAYSLGLTGWGYDISGEYKKSFLFRVSELGAPGQLPETDEEEDEEDDDE